MKVIIRNVKLQEIREGTSNSGKPYKIAVIRDYEAFEQVELFALKGSVINASQGETVMVEAVTRLGDKKHVLDGFLRIERATQ